LFSFEKCKAQIIISDCCYRLLLNPSEKDARPSPRTGVWAPEPFLQSFRCVHILGQKTTKKYYFLGHLAQKTADFVGKKSHFFMYVRIEKFEFPGQT